MVKQKGRAGGEISISVVKEKARTEDERLTRVQAQLLVVIKHRVHVFNPDGVHRPVQHQPPGQADYTIECSHC